MAVTAADIVLSTLYVPTPHLYDSWATRCRSGNLYLAMDGIWLALALHLCCSSRCYLKASCGAVFSHAKCSTFEGNTLVLRQRHIENKSTINENIDIDQFPLPGRECTPAGS